MFPLVSICIPSFNHPDLLERCLESVLLQDYKNVEIIISDDSDGDSVKIIAERYLDQMSLSYYHNNPSLGTPANWNNALDKAAGEFLMLLHHDDWLASPYSLSSCVAHFKNNSRASVLFGRSTAVDKLLRSDAEPFDASNFEAFYRNPVKLLTNNLIGPPSNVMLRKQVLQRYNTQYKWLVDLEFYIQLVLAGYKFTYLDEKLICVGLHPGQMTNFVHHNAGIIVRENVLFSGEYLHLLKDDIKVYDHFWRLLRNQSIRSRNDLMQLGLEEHQIHRYVTKILNAQAKVSLKLLKVGLFSKAYMLISYMRR